MANKPNPARREAKKEDIVFLMEHNVPADEIGLRVGLCPDKLQTYLKEIKDSSEEGFMVVTKWRLRADLLTPRETPNHTLRADFARYREILKERARLERRNE